MKVEVFRGKQILPILPEVAQVRVTSFHDFPYLFEGSIDDEDKYIEALATSPDSLAVVAESGGELVGVFTGVPLICRADDAKVLRKEISDVSKVYYLDELVVKASYRKRGIGSVLLAKIEEEARKMGYESAVFLAVVRDKNHPQRPSDYVDLEHVYVSNGYRKTEAVIQWYWPTKGVSGQVQVAGHWMRFWLKDRLEKESAQVKNCLCCRVALRAADR